MGCVRDFEARPGRGLVCVYNNDKAPGGELGHARILVGNRTWMDENNVGVPADVEAKMAKYVSAETLDIKGPFRNRYSIISLEVVW